MFKNELAFKNHEAGLQVAKMLLDENYVVLLSYEEDLLILNWEWSMSSQANRNDVVFMSREDYEDELYSRHDEDED